MDHYPISPSITIQPEHPHRLRDGAGHRVTVLHGQAWITQDGDPRDRLLVAGDDFVLDRGGLAVVTALEEEAQVALTGPERASAAPKQSFWSRLRAAHRGAAARASLRAMRDRELQDIGLCRSQIELVGR